jgi:hypothetical protein
MLKADLFFLWGIKSWNLLVMTKRFASMSAPRHSRTEFDLDNQTISPSALMKRMAEETSTSTNGKEAASPKRRNVQLSEESKMALIVEFTKIKAELGCGKKHPADWNKQLRDRYGGISKTNLARITKPGVSIVDQRKGNSGPKCVIDEELGADIKDYMKESGWNKTYKELEAHFGIDDNTIQRHFKKHNWRGVGRRNLKPLLTARNLQGRLDYCNLYRTEDFANWVDIDEKHFYSQAKRSNIKLPPGEVNPAIKTHNKRHLPSVMVLTAIARPRPEHGFDGKVGIWSCTVNYEAKRKSVHHNKGDVYKKYVPMDSEMYIRMVRVYVVAAIKRKMPWAKKVRLQTDSAGGHGMSHTTGKERVLHELSSALKVATSDVEIEVIVQPGQSPDTNCNDLGFYNSMDASMPATRPYQLDKLFKCCKDFFESYPSEKLTKIFNAKMSVIRKILAVGGDNDYT